MCSSEEMNGWELCARVGKGTMHVHVWGECVGEREDGCVGGMCLGEEDEWLRMCGGGEEWWVAYKEEGGLWGGGRVHGTKTIIELCFVSTPPSLDPFWDGGSPTTNSLPTAHWFVRHTCDRPGGEGLVARLGQSWSWMQYLWLDDLFVDELATVIIGLYCRA